MNDFDFDSLLQRIDNSCFFSRMGLPDVLDSRVILIENVEKVFVNPTGAEFKGYYDSVEWLPTSMTQEDPFYKVKEVLPKELTGLRIRVNKAVMNATKGLSKDKFNYGPHDFSLAARNGICFCFREYVSEQYLHLGNKWEEVVGIYFSGHWPVGIAKDKIVTI